MTHKQTKTVSSVLGLVIFLLGSAVLLYPEVDSFFAQSAANKLIDNALKGQVAESQQKLISGKTANGSNNKMNVAYAYLSRYNEQVRKGHGGAVNDPWGIGDDISGLENIGLKDDIIGSIFIPRLDETLPLLLNATSEHMDIGAAVVSGTSVPLGDKGSNCVIAAHRGAWHGLRMFRDIEDMEQGDSVVVQTPWDKLDYQVIETRVIQPNEFDALQVMPERDLITLFTCHPYGYNFQRYLVICERVSLASVQNVPNGIERLISQATKPSTSKQLVVERWVRVGGLLVLIVMASMGFVYFGARVVSASCLSVQTYFRASHNKRKHSSHDKKPFAFDSARRR